MVSRNFSAILLCMLLLNACDRSTLTQDTSAKAENTSASANESRVLTKDLWPQMSSEKDPAVEARVAEILGKMSLEQKVGQVIQPEIKYITPAQAAKYHIGSVLNGGGTTPYNKSDAEISEWIKLADEFYQASIKPKGDLPIIPIMWGSDAVHGHNNVKGATLFPHNIGLGAANDEDLIYRIGVATAEDVLVTGINWTFSPTVAVVRDDRWGRTYESYAEKPDIVARYAAKIVEGTQAAGGEEADLRVIATAKHYLADGGTTDGIDRGDAQISEEELVKIHAPGFVSALEANVLSVMASFSSWNGSKLHGDKYLLTDILKERMGFDGLVVGDWNAHRQVRGCTVESCPNTINAGLDIIMVPQDWEALYNNTLEQAKRGVIPQARLDDAVTRILRVKIKSGLMDAPAPSKRALSGKESLIFSQERRDLGREAVRKSLVLLKNNERTLPLAGKSKILVVGKSANDMSMQAGGWSISWQGTGTKRADFPNADTAFEGIAAALGKMGGEAIYSESGDYDGKVDAVVVVSGEYPYAEWHGDVQNLEFEAGEKSTLALIEKVKKYDAPIVTVFYSGRPLYVSPEINASDAFVAAWLPGTEGAGIADVIIGDAKGEPRYDFQGKLSFSWPKSPNQIVNHGDKDYDPLFAYGYGLSYNDKTQLEAISLADVDAKSGGAAQSSWIFVSRPLRPWILSVAKDGEQLSLVEGNYFKSEGASALELISVDQNSQEDARKVVWPKKEGFEVGFNLSSPRDLSHFVKNQGMLQFELKPEASALAKLQLAALCSGKCRFSALQEFTSDVEVGKWNTVSLPLSCFKPLAGSATIDRAFVLSGTDGSTEFANVRLIASDQVQPCEVSVR